MMPRPLLRPKPKRLPRVRRMTIAAGYVCNSGIVLCADTQETIPGFTKTNANKLIAFPCPTVTLVFAGAGDNATQIDETAYEIAARVIADSPSDGAALRKCFRESLEELFPKAHYPRAHGNVEVDMLMAVKANNHADLYRIADCSIAPVKFK